MQISTRSPVRRRPTTSSSHAASRSHRRRHMMMVPTVPMRLLGQWSNDGLTKQGSGRVDELRPEPPSPGSPRADAEHGWGGWTNSSSLRIRVTRCTIPWYDGLRGSVKSRTLSAVRARSERRNSLAFSDADASASTCAQIAMKGSLYGPSCQ